MPLFLQISTYTGFVSTEIVNILLLWLIIKKSSSNFGTYKYIMMSYAVFSMVYAVVEIMTQPIMHIDGACLFIYADSFLKSQKSLSIFLVALYCATFGSCVNLLAVHFVYRYFAICRPQDMHHFQGFKLLRVYIIPLGSSILWFFSVRVLMAPSDLKSEYMKESIMENYNEDTYELGFIAALYYYKTKSGILIINYFEILATMILCSIMSYCMITIFICGWKTYQKMESVEGNLSQKTRELNKQLFRTLVLQTLIPVCILFAPVGLFLILPLFSIGVGKLANAPGFYIGFYTAFDALVAIFMIKDFRNTVLCKKGRKKSLSNVAPANRYSSYHDNSSSHIG